MRRSETSYGNILKKHFSSLRFQLNFLGNTVQVKCLLQKEVGPCRGAVSAFFFNTYTLKCEPFIYGGCNGNENNFQTLFECEKTCGSKFFNIFFQIYCFMFV